MAIRGRPPKKTRPGRPKTKTSNQRYYEKNRTYINEYKVIKRKLETEKITETQFKKKVLELKKKYNK